jgi:hypothetical protein
MVLQTENQSFILLFLCWNYKFWGFGVLGFWGFGVWGFGVLGFWGFGVLGFRELGV